MKWLEKGQGQSLGRGHSFTRALFRSPELPESDRTLLSSYVCSLEEMNQCLWQRVAALLSVIERDMKVMKEAEYRPAKVVDVTWI